MLLLGIQSCIQLGIQSQLYSTFNVIAHCSITHLKEDQHGSMFDCSRHCGNGNIMVLVRHVILQDRVTNFMGRRPSR